ncbi:MAG: HAD-IA family hydrolase [Schwartzia sp.]|nr:HAD-IA family hydrolase [Schwartzia sp. (in: firmicutes)]
MTPENSPSPLYACYLFDFDYTLADSSKGITGCFHRAMAEFNLPPVDDMTIERTIGLPMKEAVRRITGLEGDGEIEAFLTRYRALADIHMTANTHFFPEALPTLRALKERGARIAIISSKTSGRIREAFVRDGAEHLVDFIIGCQEVRELKPSPEGIRLALERLGLSPEDALYTGDSTTDAAAAQNAGVAFFGVTHGVTTAEELAAFPHEAIGDTLEHVVRLKRRGARK